MENRTYSRNTKAIKTMMVVAGWLIYAAAILYGDIMFLSVVGVAFPDGLLRFFSYLGAITAALSAIILPFSKKYYLAPGAQLLTGIVFWSAEVAILVLNSMLAYQLALLAQFGTPLDPLMEGWRAIAPATPLVAMIGWGLIAMFDPSDKLRHAEAELEADLYEIQAEQMRQQARSSGVVSTLAAGARSKVASRAAVLSTGLPVFEQEEPETHEVAEQPRPRAKPASKPARARDTGMSLIHKAQELARQATAPNGSNGSDTENYPT